MDDDWGYHDFLGTPLCIRCLYDVGPPSDFWCFINPHKYPEVEVKLELNLHQLSYRLGLHIVVDASQFSCWLVNTYHRCVDFYGG